VAEATRKSALARGRVVIQEEDELLHSRGSICFRISRIFYKL
jgi:hypothetical protein